MLVKIKSFSIQRFFEYLFVFVTILQCNTVFYSHSKLMRIEILTAWFALFGVLIFLGFYKIYMNKLNILPLVKFILVFSMCIIVFLTVEYINVPYKIDNMFLYMIIPIGSVFIFYSDLNDRKNLRLLLEFKKVIFVIAVISLIFWFGSILKIPTNSSILIDWGGQRVIPGYFGIHYIAQNSIDFLGINTIRNTGFFDEAPMYSYVLSVGLIIKFLLDDETKRWNKETFILLFTLVTTTSTTGVLLSVLTIAYYILFVSKLKKYGWLRGLVFIILIPSVLLLFRIIVMKKMDSSWYSSSSLRLDDFYAGFMSWKDHPWIGNGLDNETSVLKYVDYRRLSMIGGSGFSNGVMNVLSLGGISLLSFYLMPVLIMIKVSTKMLGLSLLLFVLFIFTIINGVYLYIILLGYIWYVYITKDISIRR